MASFKVPSSEELDHDFLWRCQKHLPERGRIGIFNRSYYEDVLVVKVHPELLDKQKLPDAVRGKDIWDKRYKDIRHFEFDLSGSGLHYEAGDALGVIPVNDPALVQLLLDNGADTRLKNFDDFTARDLAASVACLKLLRAAG